MEVYKWNDRKLLLKLLGRLWQEDRDTYYAFKEGLIILPLSPVQEPGLVVLPGDAEQMIIEDAQHYGLLDKEEGNE